MYGKSTMYGKSNTDTNLPYIKEIANGNFLYGSGPQTGALYQSRGVGWGGRWEGGSKGMEYMYIYD